MKLGKSSAFIADDFKGFNYLKNCLSNPNFIYHVKLDWTNSNKLEKDIPYNTATYEDEVTERVCFASSLNGCLSAIQNLGEFYFRETMMAFIPISVYIVDLRTLIEDEYITPRKLVEECKVSDALVTGEHWVLKDLIIEPVKINLRELKTRRDCEDKKFLSNGIRLEYLENKNCYAELDDVYNKETNIVIDLDSQKIAYPMWVDKIVIEDPLFVETHLLDGLRRSQIEDWVGEDYLQYLLSNRKHSVRWVFKDIQDWVYSSEEGHLLLVK